MKPDFDPRTDLEISRVLRAPPRAVYRAWTDPRAFEQWWLPAPTRCKVVELDLRPGGALVTQMSENGGPFVPHMNACFLDVVPNERIVFTTALVKGWRPAEHPFITALIDLVPHPDGTDYRAHVMHKDGEQRQQHLTLGFADGWGAVLEQLSAVVVSGQFA